MTFKSSAYRWLRLSNNLDAVATGNVAPRVVRVGVFRMLASLLRGLR